MQGEPNTRPAWFPSRSGGNLQEGGKIRIFEHPHPALNWRASLADNSMSSSRAWSRSIHALPMTQDVVATDVVSVLFQHALVDEVYGATEKALQFAGHLQ